MSVTSSSGGYKLVPVNRSESSGGRDDKVKESWDEAAESDYWEDAEETRCGAGSCRPDSLQCFANMHSFTATLSLIAIVGSLNFSYFTSVISQIEKAYGLSSTMTGFIKNADNIGNIAIVLCVGHYCRHSNKPKVFAIATATSAIAVMIFALPHFLFGPDENIEMLQTNQTSYNTSLMSDMNSYPLCQRGDGDGGKCREKTYWGTFHVGALVLFLVSEVIQGMAQSPKMTLTLTYMDDNAKDDSPKYLGCMFGMRSFAPVLGFVLGAWCNRLYVDLSDPGLSERDPRWIGAWWLGFLIAGASSLLISPIIGLFPPAFKSNSPKSVNGGDDDVVAQKKQEEAIAAQESSGKVSGMAKGLGRILKNPVTMFLVMSGCFNMFMVGFFTFLPKYIALHFGVTASMASILTGCVAAFSWSLGPMISGKLMSVIKITPFTAIRFGVLTDIVAIVGYFCLMLLKCPQHQWAGQASQQPAFQSNCSFNCSCDPHSFTPVCGADQLTYRSPCMAGCSLMQDINGSKVFTDCDCAGGEATEGYCDSHCNMLLPYMIILFTTSIVAGMTIIPMMTALMRSVSHEDKALSMAVAGFVTQICSFPAPLIFGFIADSACLVHQQSCDRQGACLYYDLETFRYRFHGTASLLKLGGLLCLVGALICSRKIASKARREKKDTALRISAPENQYHLIPVIDVETSKFDTLDDFGNRSEM